MSKLQDLTGVDTLALQGRKEGYGASEHLRVPEDAMGWRTRVTETMPVTIQPVQGRSRASSWTLEYLRKGCFLAAVSASTLQGSHPGERTDCHLTGRFPFYSSGFFPHTYTQ